MADNIILRTGVDVVNEGHREPDIFELETVVDFDNITPENAEAFANKAESIARTISVNQLATQMNFMALCGIDRKGVFDEIPSSKTIGACAARGKRFFVRKECVPGTITVTGDTILAPVLSELNSDSPIEINFSGDLINLTITHCRGVNIMVDGRIKVGIELINCSNVDIYCDSFYFARVTTCNDITVTGTCRNGSMLDIRNSSYIKINKEHIHGNMFTSLRYIKDTNEYFRQVTKSEDIFDGGAQSLPDITLMKLYKTGRYAPH